MISQFGKEIELKVFMVKATLFDLAENFRERMK
jgi:hypothetical protein